MQYPKILKSDAFGEFKREGSEDSLFLGHTYETTLDIDGFQNVEVFYSPGITGPITKQKHLKLISNFKSAEVMYSELMQKKPSALLKLQHAKLKVLADEYGFEELDASEADLYRDWNLQNVILFGDGIRLIFFGNTVFPGLDLILEYDEAWKLQELHFDG
ncbi:MAG: hypothetical protein QM501_00175 [Gimesia sp.]